MSEYPKVLYRDGAQEEAHGVMVDLHFVDDEEAELAALVDGWRLTAVAEDVEEPSLPEHDPSPLDHDGDGKKGGSRPRKASAEA